MRVSIDIDEKLLDAAMKRTGLRNKRQVVEQGLLRLVADKNSPKLLGLKGKVAFVPDYDYKALRKNREAR